MNFSPDYTIKLCKKEKRGDGAVLLTVGRCTRAIRKTSEFEAAIAIGRDGGIFWHKEFNFCLMDCRLSKQETLLLMATDGRALEINLKGEIIHQWYCRNLFPEGLDGTPLEISKLHHVLGETLDGNIMSLSIQHHEMNTPDTNWTHYMADTVVVFNRAGLIVTEISLAEILDPKRFCHGAKAPYWAIQGWPNTKDWTHGNCIIQDPTDGGFLLSLRHQDCVVKLSENGELNWILGDPSGWEGRWFNKVLTIKGGRPFYHQHDLSFTSKGDLMLFDNGTASAVPPNPEQPIEKRQSFALSYSIDPKLMIANETWRYGGNDLPYSHYVSGVCELPNGNRFIACTGICEDLDGNRVEVPPMGVGNIELIEVTPDGERVFHAVLKDSSAKPDNGWNGFRPEYLPPKISNKLA